jgi:methyl-accepting chemotaxis protein
MFSFRKVLYLGFGLLIILMIIIGGASYNALSHSSNGFKVYRTLADTTNMVSRIQNNLALIRLEVKDYILTADKIHKTKFEKYLTQTKRYLEQSKTKITDHERLQAVLKIDRLLDQYQHGFEQVVVLKKIRNKKVATLNEKDSVIEQKLGRILSSAREEGDEMDVAYTASLALKNVMLVRLNVFKFLGDNRQSNVDNVNRSLDDLSNHLTKLETELHNQSYKILLRTIIKDTQIDMATFHDLVKATFQQNDIIRNTLDNIGPQTTAYIEDIKQSVKSEQDSLGPSLQHENRTATSIIALVVLVASCGGLLIGFYIVRSTFRQLGGDPTEVAGMMQNVAQGNLDLTLPDNGELPESLYASMRHMMVTLKQKATLAEMIASGDLSHDVVLASEQDGLGLALKEMMQNLTELLVEIQKSGEQITVGSEQIHKASQSLAEGATEQKGSLEHISQSLAELSSQTNTNAAHAKQANQLACQVQEAVSAGQTHMQSMIEAMDDIKLSSHTIANFIQTIDEIAEQTNLLALNAAIEAARAGEHGRGFAVVADEVRGLASKSTEAAEQTAKLIRQSENKAINGVKIAENTARSLASIIDNINGTSELIAQIAQSSVEQASGVEKAHHAVASIETITQMNASASVESAASAEALSTQTHSMQEMLKRFTFRHV